VTPIENHAQWESLMSVIISKHQLKNSNRNSILFKTNKHKSINQPK